MSTFYGGEEIIGLEDVSGTRTTSLGTTVLYVVPAGRYAKVNLVSSSINIPGIAGLAASCLIGDHSVTAGTSSGASISDGADASVYPGELIIFEGEVISVGLGGGAGGASFQASINTRVREFVNP